MKGIVNGDTFRSELTGMNIEIEEFLQKDFVIILNLTELEKLFDSYTISQNILESKVT